MLSEHSVTLELEGEHVTLEQYGHAISHFARLVAALSSAADAPALRWEVDALEISSAATTASATDLNGYDAHAARVVRDYLEVGMTLERHQPLPFAKSVQREAEAIADLVTRGVPAIRFETAEADAVVREPYRGVRPQAPARVPAAYGSVTGRVQALRSRTRLRFTLYDLLHDKAVSCYVPEGSEEMMRGIWGKLVSVEGWVTRDPDSDRAVTVRRVSAIEQHPEPQPAGYKRARGALPRRPNDPRPEDFIRLLRDGR